MFMAIRFIFISLITSVLGDIIMSASETTSSNFDVDIVKEFPIPKRWKNVIVDLFKEQAKLIEEPEEIAYLLEDWNWFRNPGPWVFRALDILARKPACSAYLMATHYFSDQGRDLAEITRKEMKKISQAFRRALALLLTTRLVRGEVLIPGEDTVLRNAVTIWVSPFAKERDIQNIKNYYLNIGGTPKKPKKVDPKSPEQLSEHNRKVKVLAIMDKYRDNPQLRDYYRCPKKHPEGFRIPRKPQSHWKKQQYVRKCKECGRELIKISYKEFMKEKYKSLCEQWEIKP
jgi:hypothetical protein